MSRVFTERSGGPLGALNLCVMRRYNLGEGRGLVSTFSLYFEEYLAETEKVLAKNDLETKEDSTSK